MKTKALPRKPPEVVPVLRFVQWCKFSKPGQCAHCLKVIPDPSFGYIEPTSDLRYHYDCKPKGKWKII